MEFLLATKVDVNAVDYVSKTLFLFSFFPQGKGIKIG